MDATTGDLWGIDPTREPMVLPDLAAAVALVSGFGFLMAPAHQSYCKGVTVAVLIY